MKAFSQFRNRSADYARNRMKLLLVSERIDCSPQMMKLLKDDMIRIELSWVPDRIGSGWSFREIILTPEWQTVKNGDDWNWMHPIEDGEALYEQVYELIYG